MTRAAEILRLWRRVGEFGGLRLVCQYARMGVLGAAVRAVAATLWRGEHISVAYQAIARRVGDILRRQYMRKPIEGRNPFLRLAPCVSQERIPAPHGNPHILWTCWLQGEDAAPELVRICWQSLRRAFPVYELRIVTLSNYRHWIMLPDYIERKYRRHHIPAASMSDILRTALLAEYGGTWFDATVLCTLGLEAEGEAERRHRSFAREMMDSELTLFRYRRHGRTVGVSNWFIAARPGNPLLLSVRDLLLAYWRDYDCLVLYYIMHLFIEQCATDYPTLFRDMPKANSRYALLLAPRLGDDYDREMFSELLAHVFIHKLNYRLVGERQGAKSYYSQLKEIYKP